MYRILIMVILFLAAASLSRAETINYGNIVRDTLRSSARIRLKLAEINIANAVYRQNFAGLFPEISGVSRFERHENLDHRNDGYTTINGEVIGGDASGWRSSAGLTGSYYFSHWYKKRFEASYYERLRDMRIHECDIEVKKIIRELTDIFSAVAEGKIRLNCGGDILNRMRDVALLKRQAFAGGQISYEDVLKGEADIAATEKEMAATRKEFHENIARLRSLTGNSYGEEEVEYFHTGINTGINTDNNNVIKSGINSGMKSSINTGVNTRINAEKQWRDHPEGIANTPELKAREKELEAARFKSKATANNFWPDISLYGRYDYYGSHPNAMDSAFREVRETAYSAGIMISLPIFDGGIRKWQRKQSIYEIKKQEESVIAVTDEKGKDLRILAVGYRELIKSLTQYRKLADLYGKMLTITKKASALGERNLMDIMEMEKETLIVDRDLKVTEHALAVYDKRMALEMDYEFFISGHEGGRVCK